MAPSGAFEALFEEIDRILQSPYPTQLKILRDIVSTQCTEEDISRWVLLRPCQLHRLVRYMLDALQQWPYILELVAKLSHCVAFRNAFLEADPNLLHDIVVQAAQAEKVHSRYAGAAVAMLTHRLPKDVAMPMECQTLLVRLVDHAAQQPSVTSIRPIYQLLRGSSALLLGVLSDGALLRFEDHLFTIVRNLKGDDQSLSLYCLAIMKALAQASNEYISGSVVSSYDTQELLASTEVSITKKWKPDAVQQYFTERKAQKTMQLVVLRVMWACTAATSDSLDDKTECLQLANEIIAAVPSKERGLWRKANALIPKKLEDKLTSQALDAALRFKGLCFLLRLTEGTAVPITILNGLRHIFLDIQGIRQIFLDFQSDSIDNLIHIGVFDSNTTTSFMQNAVDFTSSAAPEEVAEKSSSLTSILRHLLVASTWQDSIVDGIMLALDVLACGHKLRCLETSMKHSSSSAIESACQGLCLQASQNNRRQLIHELCKVFLRASLVSSQSSYSIPRETLALLLELHASSAHETTKCAHGQDRRSTARKRAFVEAQCTPGQTTVDWREHLHLEMAAQSASHVESLERLFAKACGELEERCNNIEQPLREGDQRLAVLQARYDELLATHSALENESIDRNVQFHSLETERDQALAEVHTFRDDNEVLSARIKELQEKVRDAAEEANKTVEEGRRTLERAELAYAAVLASKEEELEDALDARKDLRVQLEDMHSEVENLQAKLTDTALSLQTSHDAVNQLQQWKIQHESAVHDLTAERDAARLRIEQLQAMNTDVGAQLVDMETKHEAEICRIEEKAMQQLALQKTEYETRMAKMSNEHTAVTEEIKLKLADVENNALREHGEHEMELHRRDAELSETQKKLERLYRKYEQKAQQVASATAMQQNIASAMGLKTFQMESLNLPHRSSRRPLAQTPQNQKGEEDESQDPSPPTPFSSDGCETRQQQIIVNESFSDSDLQSGRTSKRPRSKKAFKIPSPAKPHTRLSTASRTTRATLRVQSAGKRKPLMSVGPNCRAPAAVDNAKTPVKGDMEYLDETTWDGSELFAGTQI